MRLDVQSILNDLESKTRDHREIGSPTEPDEVVTLCGETIHPGFIYGYCFTTNNSKENWAGLIGNLSKENPRPVLASFSDDLLPEEFNSAFAASYRVTSIEVFEKIMRAHLNEGDKTFILSPVDALSLEKGGFLNELYDVLQSLSNLITQKSTNGSLPIIIITTPECEEGSNHNRRTLYHASQKLFNQPKM
jgi:hypothetical protein